MVDYILGVSSPVDWHAKVIVRISIASTTFCGFTLRICEFGVDFLGIVGWLGRTWSKTLVTTLRGFPGSVARR